MIKYKLHKLKKYRKSMNIREMIDKVKNFGRITVYKCVDGIFDKNKNNVEYFAVNLEYAKHFGDNCYKITLETSNFKILKLEDWNKIYTEKTGKKGNAYNRHQGIFVIGYESITTKYEEPLNRFRVEMGDEMANQFLSEFETSDAVYGEDAGYVGDFVYAVKNKEMIVNFEALQ